MKIAALATGLVFALACGKKDKEETPKTDPKTTATTDKVADKMPEPPAATVAVATLKPTEGNKVEGTVTLTALADGKVSVEADIKGLTPGDHGFHIHETGDCSAADGTSAGGHFNPGKVDHGAPGAAAHHAGDLGNLTADDAGVATTKTTIDFVTLDDGERSAIGKAFIVHDKADDMTTQPTGNAGARVACGVIAKK